MFLSDREMAIAIKSGRLIVHPPTEIGPTSIDLRLDAVEEAKIWDIQKLKLTNKEHGNPELELRISKCDYGRMSKLYHVSPPTDKNAIVFRRGNQIVLKPGGFVLWQTKERVGTPTGKGRYMCFVDGKSTRARTGLVVHLTAPTIHAGWSGNVTLELANFGPFHIVLEEDDVVAQITVAQVSSIPKRTMEMSGSVTQGQRSVGGKN